MEDEVARQIAEQLARPSGERGVKVTEAMNETNAFITARCVEAVGARPGEGVLEIGPGNGRLSLDVVRSLGPTGRYLGFEIEPEIAALARQALTGAGADVDVRSGDFTTHPLEEGRFDALMAVNVVYFVDDLEAFVRRCGDWLVPGGRAIIGLRSVRCMAALPFSQHGFRLRPLDDLLRALHLAGFEGISARYHDEGPTQLGDLTIDPVDSIIVTARRR